ncbi:prevent-host-death protein [Cryobacterium sp. Hh7]|uniref:prevent-host-death protein n=1 Tax=Cryobacterium sp. Hh7 TaxID=1259159 RepID=UPI0010690534|nr:prevent-host-death protein [Cryobacterium sp. Hh7]TFD61301.1 prevent-host-death protein [Cryobacterium sp. Hh7]
MRTHLKEVLDASARGQTVTMQRGGLVSVVMSAELLRTHLFRVVSPRLRLSGDDSDRTTARMEGRPFVSEGIDADGALADLVLSLREYADAWEDRLGFASNHSGNWGLIQLITLSTDEQLVEWLERGGEQPPVS